MSNTPNPLFGFVFSALDLGSLFTGSRTAPTADPKATGRG